VNLTIENLVMLAVVGLLIILRFDARRFGAADFDDETAISGWRVWARRLSWYGVGIALVFVVYFLFAQPETLLHLRLGEPRGFALFAGLALALLGGGAALAYAWWRFGGVNLPDARAYPVGLLNSLATAFIDEATFRGIVLGLLLFFNWPPLYAVAFQAVVYALATRLGGAGRPRSLLLLTLAIGLLGGWLTVATGGIGGALLAHAVTRFAIFVTTGHAGQVTPSAASEEDDRSAAESSDVGGLEVVADREPSRHLRALE
jgi:membrane protease YdiL (CAAX protease family)